MGELICVDYRVSNDRGTNVSVVGNDALQIVVTAPLLFFWM